MSESFDILPNSDFFFMLMVPNRFAFLFSLFLEFFFYPPVIKQVQTEATSFGIFGEITFNRGIIPENWIGGLVVNDQLSVNNMWQFTWS